MKSKDAPPMNLQEATEWCSQLQADLIVALFAQNQALQEELQKLKRQFYVDKAISTLKQN